MRVKWMSIKLQLWLEKRLIEMVAWYNRTSMLLPQRYWAPITLPEIHIPACEGPMVHGPQRTGQCLTMVVDTWKDTSVWYGPIGCLHTGRYWDHHYDGMTWKHYLNYWPFVQGIHWWQWSSVDSLYKWPVIQSSDDVFIVSLIKPLNSWRQMH